MEIVSKEHLSNLICAWLLVVCFLLVSRFALRLYLPLLYIIHSFCLEKMAHSFLAAALLVATTTAQVADPLRYVDQLIGTSNGGTNRLNRSPSPLT